VAAKACRIRQLSPGAAKSGKNFWHEKCFTKLQSSEMPDCRHQDQW
jgi:hypothetical protein